MSRLYNMKEGSALLDQFSGGSTMWAGLTIGEGYFVDPTNGAGSGTSPQDAASSLLTAYNLCATNRNDTVNFIGGPTAWSPTASLTWAKDYTHLRGLSADLPGMGQRCRISGSAAADLTPVVTFSGDGCVIENIQVFNGSDAGTAKGAVTVSGDRNLFRNCFFAGMGHATNAAVAGSFSVTVSGSENTFVNCTIGLDTIVRAAANSELIVTGIRNTFINCMFLSNSVTAGKFLVKIDNSGGDLRWTRFHDCTFYNYTENWATGITNAFDMPAAGSTHSVLLTGNNTLAGVGSGWADTVTHVYSAAPAPNAGFGIATNPTT